MSEIQTVVNPEQSYIQTSLSVVEPKEDDSIAILTIITNEVPRSSLGTNKWAKILNINDLKKYYHTETNTYKMVANAFSQTNCNGFNFSFTRLNGYINLIYTSNFTDATRSTIITDDLGENIKNFSDKEGFLTLVYQKDESAEEEVEKRYVVFPRFTGTEEDDDYKERNINIIASQLNKAQFNCHFNAVVEEVEGVKTYKILITSKAFGSIPLSCRESVISKHQQSWGRVDLYGTEYLNLSGLPEGNINKGNNSNGENFTDIISRLNGIKCHFVAPVMRIDVDKLSNICKEFDDYYSQNKMRYGLVYTCPSSFELKWLNNSYENNNYQHCIMSPCYYGDALLECRGALISYLGSRDVRVEPFVALELKSMYIPSATDEAGMSLEDYERVKQTRFYGYFFEGNNSYRTQGSVNALQPEHISIVMQNLMAFVDYIKQYTKSYSVGKNQASRQGFLDYLYSMSGKLLDNGAIGVIEDDALLPNTTQEERDSIKSRGIYFSLAPATQAGADLRVNVSFGENNNYVSFKLENTMYVNK